MNTTRNLIFQSLRTHGERTVAELASEQGISQASVRHHLTALQAQSLVEAQEVRQNVGRPHFSYQLTRAGLEQSPGQYIRPEWR